jgi:Mn2+/Fe2+ NRAMP family transporter
MGALFWSALINGVVVVPILTILILLASKPAVMQQARNRPNLKPHGLAGRRGHGASVVGMVVPASI